MDRYYLAFIKQNKLKFVLMLLGLSVSVFMTIPIPLLTRYIIDNVLVSKNLNLLMPITGCFVAVATIQLAIGRLNAWMTSSFSQDFINQTRSTVVQQSLQHPLYGGCDDGNLMVVINSDIPNLSQIDLTIISTFINSLVSIVAYSIMLFALNWQLAILALVILPLYVLWIWHIGKRMEILNRQTQLMNEELLASTSNIAKNQETIVSYRFSNRIAKDFEVIARKIGSFNKGVVMYTNFAGSISLVITTAACFIPIIVGSYYVVAGEITIGTLVVFNAYCTMLISPISSLVNLITKHNLRKVHVERIDQYLVYPKEEDEKVLKVSNTESVNDYGIELCDFALYSGSRILLNTNYLDIQQGHTVLLKGDNGTGKTLLLKAISGLYPCYKGDIFIDDIRVSKCQEIIPTQSVMYVSSSQPFVLDSIYDELEEQCKISEDKYNALLQDFEINSILMSLEDRSNARGEGLPMLINAGSMQRLRILRALVQNPKYLLLDEILSNIDGVHYESILHVIRQHFPQITIVLVEHHLDFHGWIDEVYQIENGGISLRSYA